MSRASTFFLVRPSPLHFIQQPGRLHHNFPHGVILYDVTVTGFLLIAAIVLGHALLVRAVLNRFYTLGLRERAWKLLCLSHGIVGVVVGFLLVRQVGTKGPAVLRGGDLADSPWGWIAYCLLCIVVLSAVLLLNTFRVVPGAVVKLDRRRGRASEPPSSRLRLIPGNEVFQFDLVRLELAIPRLRAGLDGMSILHISDLHLNGAPDRKWFEHALQAGQETKPDLIALTGDVVDRHELLEWLPETLGKLSAPLGRFFVLGNHDAWIGADPIRAALMSLDWTHLGGLHHALEHRGERIMLAGSERPWIGQHPDVSADGALRILLAHTPDLFAWAAQSNFDLMLAGHMHGGQIQLPLLGPLCGGRYHSGVFQKQQTVMHVTRGLGQMFPYRYRCAPEIVNVILRMRAGQEPAPQKEKAESSDSASSKYG